MRKSINVSNLKYESIFLAIGYLFVVGISAGQVQQSLPLNQTYGPDRTKLPEALAKIKSGNFAGVHVDIIAESGVTEAIPSLEEQFARSEDPIIKAKLAQGLVKLGDKNDAFWNYLVGISEPIIRSTAPSPIKYDFQGKSLPGLSPDWMAWAKSNNASPESAQESVYMNPGIIMLLGGSDDRRAIPLLRQALLSTNYLVEAAAARGLADIKDTESVPLIINASENAPSEAAAAIAEALVYFDDSEAQGAVDKFVPKNLAKSMREEKAKGKTPFH